jgi:hypothetical protein
MLIIENCNQNQSMINKIQSQAYRTKYAKPPNADQPLIFVKLYKMMRHHPRIHEWGGGSGYHISHHYQLEHRSTIVPTQPTHPNCVNYYSPIPVLKSLVLLYS